MPSFTATLDEQVFMEQPPGVRLLRGSRLRCGLLKKAIYGLKQSPRAWFHKFLAAAFSRMGFVSTVSDPTVMRKRTPHGCVILAVYVGRPSSSLVVTTLR